MQQSLERERVLNTRETLDWNIECLTLSIAISEQTFNDGAEL
jgi:hypothetical protein